MFPELRFWAGLVTGQKKDQNPPKPSSWLTAMAAIKIILFWGFLLCFYYLHPKKIHFFWGAILSIVSLTVLIFRLRACYQWWARVITVPRAAGSAAGSNLERLVQFSNFLQAVGGDAVFSHRVHWYWNSSSDISSSLNIILSAKFSFQILWSVWIKVYISGLVIG